MRLHRFYVSQPLGEDVVIDDVSIINQWLKVFRYKKSDLVILFNGSGFDTTYLISSISLKECTLTKKESTPSYSPHKKVRLFLSLIKKDLFELAVQKATEIGVTDVVPVISERSLDKNLNEERLRKITIESAEQCLRGDIPSISKTITCSNAIESISPTDISIYLDKDGIPYKDLVLQKKIHTSNSINLFIGPEGGWTDKEINTFNDNAITCVSLGDTTLRAETAAIVASFIAAQ